MATQHPDNASAPYWEKHGDGFVSVQEEISECVSAYRDLGVEEFMWDWEGKYTDEAVIDKLFTKYHDFFQRRHIGRETFLTFRIPNIWHERSYSLMRAFMVILTSEDFAKDLGMKSPPLFEVILPMTERAEELMFLQKTFRRLARFKTKVFNRGRTANTDYLEIIPLVESVEGQMEIVRLLEKYRGMHDKAFQKPLRSLRVFLARSDPAMVSGFIPATLGNKIALARMEEFSKKSGIEIYPVIGAGSLVFRGGLAPGGCGNFLHEYKGVRTLTLQSAFRYDYPSALVKKETEYLNKNAGRHAPRKISEREERVIRGITQKFEKAYRESLRGIVKTMNPIFAAVPRRRERKLHIGFLAYQRKVGDLHLPRAISFTAGFYSIGVPPEFIGLGRTLEMLDSREFGVLKKHYVYLKKDVERAGRYLVKENIKMLEKKNTAWRLVAQDVELAEKIFGISLGPKTEKEHEHARLARKALTSLKNKKALQRAMIQSGKIRRSLG